MDQEVANIYKKPKVLMKIMSYFPNHNIKSEESNFIDNNSNYTWFVDPLDGTRDFVQKSGEYAVHLGLIFKNKPIQK